MLAAVLANSLGCTYKIAQLAAATRGLDSATVTIAVLVYGGMALGFLSLLAWAAARGLFHDVEQPKYRMLEQEEEYEREGI
jgi:hypothetical protein